MARNHPTRRSPPSGWPRSPSSSAPSRRSASAGIARRAERDLRGHRRARRPRSRSASTRPSRPGATGRSRASRCGRRRRRRSTVTVTASGLRRGDHISVEVEQLLRGSDRSWKPGLPLYGASLGPERRRRREADRRPVRAARRLRRHRRPRLGRRRAGALLRPRARRPAASASTCPRPQERPQLSVDWETFVTAPRLLVKLKARNLQQPARWMALRVYGDERGPAAAHARRVGARAGRRRALRPPRRGRRRPPLSDVCVVASTTTRVPECPPADDDGTVWARLAVPANSYLTTSRVYMPSERWFVTVHQTS